MENNNKKQKKRKLIITKFNILTGKKRGMPKIPAFLIEAEEDLNIDDIYAVVLNEDKRHLYLIDKDDNFYVVPLSIGAEKLLKRKTEDVIALFNCKIEELDNAEGRLVIFAIYSKNEKET